MKLLKLADQSNYLSGSLTGATAVATAAAATVTASVAGGGWPPTTMNRLNSPTVSGSRRSIRYYGLSSYLTLGSSTTPALVARALPRPCPCSRLRYAIYANARGMCIAIVLQPSSLTSRRTCYHEVDEGGKK